MVPSMVAVGLLDRRKRGGLQNAVLLGVNEWLDLLDELLPPFVLLELGATLVALTAIGVAPHADDG